MNDSNLQEQYALLEEEKKENNKKTITLCDDPKNFV